MKNNIQFAVLEYYTSFVHSEHLNIGILFYNESTKKTKLEITNNWTRVSNFDDQLDIEMFKILLSGIQEELEVYNFSGDQDFSMSNFTQYYVNELKFSDISEVCIEDFDVFVNDTKRMYLTYDYEVNERPSKDEQIQYVKRIIRGRDIPYNSRPIVGAYDESIKFDCILQKRYAIKFFDFTDKELARCINTAKVWKSNAIDLKDKYKCIYIYNVQIEHLSDVNQKSLNSILEILGSEATIYNISDGIKFINDLTVEVFDIA